MGRGIAYASALGGFRTVLQDSSGAALEKAHSDISATLEKGVATGKVAGEDAAAAQRRLSLARTLEEAVREADLVIEAVPESMELKIEIFSALDRLAPKSASSGVQHLLALDHRDGGRHVATARRCVGMHFFNPVHRMKLLEVVRALETSEESIAAACEVGVAMGKECVVVRESPGFVTSRINAMIGNEAFYMLQEGVASARDIDQALKLGLNHPMGPFELVDLVGLDTRLAILKFPAPHARREVPPVSAARAVRRRRPAGTEERPRRVRVRRRMSPARRGSGGRNRAGSGAAKKSSSRGAKKSAAKKSIARAPKPVARRPRLELVRRRRPKSRAVPPEAFPQTSGASQRQRVMFELVRARAALLASVQGLTAASAEQPLGAGKWTLRETVLHVCARDDLSLHALEPALHGIPPDWAKTRGAALERLNAEGVDALRHHRWDEALRLLQWSRQLLMESAEGVAEEPAQVWERGHPFGALLLDLASNDRRQAEAIKRWRTGRQP